MDLSIILACYNEESIFESSMRTIVRILRELPYSAEIIFVDDFSQDNTRALINQSIERHPGQNPLLKKIFHERNLGRGRSVSDGFRDALGEVVGFLDIDLEVPVYYIPEFVRGIKDGYDAVIAHRVYSVPISQIHRWVLSRGYSFLTRKLLNLPFSDTEAGFKFFRREKVLPILDKVKNERWFWDTEIMTRCFEADLKMKQVSVLFMRHPKKKSTVNIFRDSFDYFVKLFSFRKQMAIDTYWRRTPENFEDHYQGGKGLGKIVERFLINRQSKIEKLLDIQPNQKVLDVGCGSGVILEKVVQKGGFAVGLDYSQKTLDLAKKRLDPYPKNSYQLILADTHHLPFNEGAFDCLIASGLLDYIEETEKVLSEFQRVLEKGGTLIITVPKKASPFWFLRTSWGNFLRKKFLDLPPIIRWFSWGEIQQLLEKNSFKIETSDSVFGTMWILKCYRI